MYTANFKVYYNSNISCLTILTNGANKTLVDSTTLSKNLCLRCLM